MLKDNEERIRKTSQQTALVGLGLLIIILGFLAPDLSAFMNLTVNWIVLVLLALGVFVTFRAGWADLSGLGLATVAAYAAHHYLTLGPLACAGLSLGFALLVGIALGCLVHLSRFQRLWAGLFTAGVGIFLGWIARTLASSSAKLETNWRAGENQGVVWSLGLLVLLIGITFVIPSTQRKWRQVWSKLGKKIPIPIAVYGFSGLLAGVASLFAALPFGDDLVDRSTYLFLNPVAAVMVGALTTRAMQFRLRDVLIGALGLVLVNYELGRVVDPGVTLLLAATFLGWLFLSDYWTEIGREATLPTTASQADMAWNRSHRFLYGLAAVAAGVVAFSAHFFVSHLMAVNTPPGPVVLEQKAGMVWARNGLAGEWKEAAPQMILGVTDTLLTRDDAHAVLRCADRSVIQIDPNSQLQIAGMRRTSVGDTPQNLYLTTGRIWAKVRSLANTEYRFEVQTPTAVAAVRGTSFSVEAPVNREPSTFSVWEGFVDVDSEKEKVNLGPQQEASVSETGAASTRPMTESMKQYWSDINRKLHVETPADINRPMTTGLGWLLRFSVFAILLDQLMRVSRRMQD